MLSRRPYLLALILAVYGASYLWLSRRGYDEADRWNGCGFYYFTPENSDVWRVKHFGCAEVFAPLNGIDRALGTGRAPAKEPLWGLSR
jgi:hypothetical protein